MELTKEMIMEYNEQYGISPERITSYYQRIMKYPIVAEGDFSLALSCLEYILQDEASKDFNDELRKMQGVPASNYKNLDYVVSDALYRAYGESSIPYLDPQYLEINHNRYGIK